MRADPPSVPPLPDSRALLVVVDAVRNAPGSTRDALVNATLNHPEAPGFDAGELRRLAESYADAREGFRRPQAGAGYVLAAFYTMRRRVGLWIGVPFVVLLTLGLAFWGLTELNQRQELTKLRSRCTAQIERARQDGRAAGGQLDTVENAVRSAQPPLPNEARIRDLIQAFRERQSAAMEFLSDYEPYRGLDPRRIRQLRREADDVRSQVSAMENLLQQVKEQFDKSTELRIARDELDGLLKEARAMNLERFQMKFVESTHSAGVFASEQGNSEKLRGFIQELSEYLLKARELSDIPKQLNALVAQFRAVALDDEDRKRVENVYRDGRDAAAASNLPVLKESVRQLQGMAAKLEEEYTIVITGGKWRTRRNNPSVKNYYVLVEAVDRSGRRLPRMVKNEEEGGYFNVTTWGERVPFDVYERVRLDKQDNGVIDRNEFARKERGRLEERVTLRLENGEPLPRVGQITRW
ncbi:MAG TPA: DUF6384 family protein [Planctomycetota bacterium]|nr:DUF6384 family protein [Planctomycetota bacterium]